MRSGLCFGLSYGLPALLLLAGAANGAEAESKLAPGDLTKLRLPASYALHGIAKPVREAKVSASLTGVLRHLHVEEGDLVEAKQILAVIDDRIATKVVQVAQAAANQSAQIKHAEQALNMARLRLTRVDSLKTNEAATTYEVEEANKDLRQAEANLDVARQERFRAQRQLELEQTRLELHTIRAPFRGRVVHIKAAIGETIQDGRELLTLVNMEALKVELHLPLSWYGKLNRGQHYTLIADSPLNRKVNGQLQYISPLIDSPTRSFRCVFSIDNRDLKFPSGFDVRLDTMANE